MKIYQNINFNQFYEQKYDPKPNVFALVAAAKQGGRKEKKISVK